MKLLVIIQQVHGRKFKDGVSGSEGYVPADCGARHGGNDTRAHAPQETRPAKLTLDDASGVPQTLCRPHLLAVCESSGLKERLYNIKWGGNTSCDGTGQTACHAVGEWVVILLRIHHLRDRLIGNELCGREGHGHAECGRVGDVKGLDTFSAVEGLGALRQGLVDGAVDLHTLLHD